MPANKILFGISFLLFLFLVKNISQDVIHLLNLKKETANLKTKIENKKKDIKVIKSIIQKQSIKINPKIKLALKQHFSLNFYNEAGFKINRIVFIGKEIKKNHYSFIPSDIFFIYKTKLTLLRLIALLHASSYVEKIVDIKKTGDHSGIINIVFKYPI